MSGIKVLGQLPSLDPNRANTSESTPVSFCKPALFRCSPKGPCTPRVDTEAPKHPCRDYFKAKVYTICVHGPLEFVFLPTLSIGLAGLSKPNFGIRLNSGSFPTVSEGPRMTLRVHLPKSYFGPKGPVSELLFRAKYTLVWNMDPLGYLYVFVPWQKVSTPGASFRGVGISRYAGPCTRYPNPQTLNREMPKSLNRTR